MQTERTVYEELERLLREVELPLARHPAPIAPINILQGHGQLHLRRGRRQLFEILGLNAKIPGQVLVA